jgi:hypothetical protein
MMAARRLRLGTVIRFLLESPAKGRFSASLNDCCSASVGPQIFLDRTYRTPQRKRWRLRQIIEPCPSGAAPGANIRCKCKRAHSLASRKRWCSVSAHPRPSPHRPDADASAARAAPRSAFGGSTECCTGLLHTADEIARFGVRDDEYPGAQIARREQR